MQDIALSPVKTDSDLDLLDEALRRLSGDLGDSHAAGRAALARALGGAHPAAHGMLALLGDTGGIDSLRGAALFSPVFSTVRGAAGVYVSDLWVADAARGLGLGRRLLGAVGVRAGRLWRARWLTLAVYDHSTASRRFYDRLGFEPQTDATVMKLGPERFAELMRNAG